MSYKKMIMFPFLGSIFCLTLLFLHFALPAGLNLMAADHCFLMDPAKNSAIEEQAIDR